MPATAARASRLCAHSTIDVEYRSVSIHLNTSRHIITNRIFRKRSPAVVSFFGTKKHHSGQVRHLVQIKVKIDYSGLSRIYKQVSRISRTSDSQNQPLNW